MEWISVKDKLPEENQTVLMYHEGECFIGWIQIVYSDGYAVFKETGGKYNIPATHWMAFSEPTKQ